MAEKTKAEQLSETFRSVTGLPARKNDKPISGGQSDALRLATEPEGGYGGKGGISNTAAVNASEAKSAEMAAERAAEDIKAAEAGEVEALTPDGAKESEADAKTGNTVKTEPAKKTRVKK